MYISMLFQSSVMFGGDFSIQFGCDWVAWMLSIGVRILLRWVIWRIWHCWRGTIRWRTWLDCWLWSFRFRFILSSFFRRIRLFPLSPSVLEPNFNLKIKNNNNIIFKELFNKETPKILLWHQLHVWQNAENFQLNYN